MPLKMDAYDMKILGALLDNARSPLSKIAKKSRLRRENAQYRLSRLVDLGTIRAFSTVLDEEKLGLSHYVAFVALGNANQESERKMVEYLKGL